MLDRDTAYRPSKTRARAEALAGERFEVLAELGAGGFGTVFEVRDTQSGAHLAMKVLRATDVENRVAFKREFRALTGVHHRNLVTLYELFGRDEDWAFTMEIVRGRTFIDHVVGAETRTHPSTERTQPPRIKQRTVRLDQSGAAAPVKRDAREFDVDALHAALHELAAGLRHLHDKGWVHRDIKPQNVLVQPDGRVVLLDFGLMGHSWSPEERGVLGTPPYMAPEVRRGEPPTPQSDWFSVGALLHEALTGTPPNGGVIPAEVPTDLRALCRSLLKESPLDRGGAEAILRERAAPQRTPFVGRRVELQALESALDRVRRSEFSGIALTGPAGSGKTALCRTFLTNVDALVLTSKCHPSELVPFKALDGIIDDLAGYLASGDVCSTSLSSEARATLCRVFPAMEALDAPAVGADAPSVGASALVPSVLVPRLESRRRATEALRVLLEDAARTRTLVLHIDDLHWGDLDSLRVLELLLRAPAPPVLLLLTHRDDPNDIVQEMHRALPDIRTVPVGPLAIEDAISLSEELRSETLSVPELSGLLERADGNAFLVSESLRTDGLSTAEVVQSRLEALTPIARAVLDTLCVAGHPLTLRQASLDHAKTDEALDALSGLRAHRLLREGSYSFDSRLEPYHARVRDTVTELLHPAARKHLHGRLVDLLEGDGAPAHVLAMHCDEAGRADEAARWAQRAGDQAMQTLAFDRAAEMYAMAVRRQSTPAPDLRLLLAEALVDAGRGSEAGDVYMGLAESHPSRPELMRNAAEQYLRSGRLREGMLALDRVLGRVGLELHDTPLRSLPALAGALGRSVFDAWIPRRESAPERERLDACWTATTGLGLVDPVRAASFGVEGLRLAKRLGDEHAAARSELMQAGFMASSGRIVAATHQLEAAIERAACLRDPWIDGLGAAMQAVIAYEDARWGETLERCTHAESVFQGRCVGVSWELRTIQLFELSALFFLGELERLRQRCRETLRDAELRGDLYAMTNVRTQLLPSVHLSVDDPASARAEVRGAIASWPARGFSLQHNYALGTETIIDLYEDRARDALERIEANVWNQRQSLMMADRSVRMFWRFLRSTTTVAAVRAGAPRSLLRRVKSDARRLAHGGTAAYRGWARVLRAGIAQLEGDDASSLLNDAIDEFRCAEMGMYADAAMLWKAEFDDVGDAHANAILSLRDRGAVDPRAVARAILGGAL